MSYSGAAGEVTAQFSSSAARRKAGAMQVVAAGSSTHGAFGLFRQDLPAGAPGPAPHFHRTFSESFYVLHGNVRLYAGSRWVVAAEGDFLFVPPGGIHAFGNAADAPSALLILFAPGIARERYFIELAEIGKSGRQLSAEEWTEFYARHDQFMV